MSGCSAHALGVCSSGATSSPQVDSLHALGRKSTSVSVLTSTSLTMVVVDGPSTSDLPEVRIFVGDSSGRIKTLYTKSKVYESLTIPGCRYGSAAACQALVCGTLNLDEPVCVVSVLWLTQQLAIARKNGTLDIVKVPHPEGDKRSECTLLCTIREERMRVGLERWVGLRLTPEYVRCFLTIRGLFSCTSGGFFRYVPLQKCCEGVTLNEVSDEIIEQSACKWTVPSPLHFVAFYPENESCVTHFASGGEQVLLSIWDIKQTLDHYSTPESSAIPSKNCITESKVESAQENTGKKRGSSHKSSKGQELLPGEIWRAKNLPNDHLSLARPPLIRCISFLPPSSNTHDGNNPLINMRVIVGTKDGVLRVYEPVVKPRHVHEWQVVPKNQGSIRVIRVCPSERAIFVGDTLRHLYMVDIQTGRTLFKYKDITGTVSEVLTLNDVPRDRTLVIGSSLDHLIRVFDTGKPHGSTQRQRGKLLDQYFTGVDHAICMALDPNYNLDMASPEHEDDEKVWANMAVVGKDDPDSDTDEASAKRSEKRHRISIETRDP